MWRISMNRNSALYGKQRSGGDTVLLGRARADQIRDDHGLDIDVTFSYQPPYFYSLGPRVIYCDLHGI